MTASPKPAADAGKAQLVTRLSRIRRQVDAPRRAFVEPDAPRASLPRQATACRGAMDGIIADVIEDGIREQAVQARAKVEATRAADGLIGIVHSYLT